MTGPILEVTEPGIYDGLDDIVYHGDPVPDGSLSVSGAKTLLGKCPAVFLHERTHGRPNKKHFDYGHAAHKLVLGTGPKIVLVDADNWMTKAAREKKAEAYAAGAVPLLAKDMVDIQAMADAVADHPIASVLFHPDSGKAEQSLFVRDERTGVMLRGRLDWMPHVQPDGRLIIPDYKTCDSADLDAIAKACANYGYNMQDPWYSDLIRALGLAEDVAFVFVFQEKTAPYLVSVVELDRPAKEIGRIRNRHAIDLYAECMATNTWPAYTTDVAQVALPSWYTRRELENV